MSDNGKRAVEASKYGLAAVIGAVVMALLLQFELVGPAATRTATSIENRITTLEVEVRRSGHEVSRRLSRIENSLSNLDPVFYYRRNDED